MAVTVGTDRTRGEATDCSPEVSRLYEAYSDRIFGYCLYRLGNRTEAEDAVQTTFMYVFRSLQRGVELENESAWLFTIAHNVCRSTRRSARRRRRVETQQDPQLLQELSPGFERDNDSLLGLEDALSSIPATQRQAILMREWQGMPYREIAATLGVSQTAVEMLVFRARRSLATALDRGPQPARRRIASALNIASLVSFARNVFGGASAANVTAAAGVAVVAVGIGGSMPALHSAAPPARSSVTASVSHPAPQQPHAGLAAQPTRSSHLVRSGSRFPPQRSALPTMHTSDDAPAASAISETTDKPVTSPAKPQQSPTPATATSTSVPVQSIVSELPVGPSIAAVPAPALPPIEVTVPTPSLPVALPSVTVPSVTGVTNTVGSALPKLP